MEASTYLVLEHESIYSKYFEIYEEAIKYMKKNEYSNILKLLFELI